MPNIRKEPGSLGVSEVRADRLWCDQTQRLLEFMECLVA
jgi:fumarate hydratase class II